MIDATLRAYATRLAGTAVLAGLLAAGVAATSPTGARSVTGSSPVTGQSRSLISGLATVVDGDTIAIDGVRIRLEGIDAPEASQSCERADGTAWACGHAATRELIRIVANQAVDCEDLGPDKYGRTLGVCFVGGQDINAEMVRRGLAWAFVKYSPRYVAVEAQARAGKAGIWQGAAVPAWDFRVGRWQAAEPAAPEGCAIKGNVTKNGRIYHLPWSPWYEKVRMDAGSGKRWFCTEAEAMAAGWRPAQVF